jgi:hypothetical protein
MAAGKEADIVEYPPIIFGDWRPLNQSSCNLFYKLQLMSLAGMGYK